MSSNWQTVYQSRTVSARKALSAIRSGSRVFMAAGCGRPQLLVDELVNLGNKIADIELIHLMTFGLAPYTSAEYHRRFRHNALFICSDVATAITDGRADFTPTDKLQIATLIENRSLPLDFTLIQVSPPDDRGYLSTGITVGISKTAAEAARHVIAQVNPRMPRTCGDTLLHVEQIDAFVQSDMPLLEAPAREVDQVHEEIARHCSRLIQDGATINVGYTPVAYALPKYLARHRHLGIHTDILTPPLVQLIDQGVVDNSLKTFNAGKTITSLCYGTQEIYRYLGDNPQVEFYPALYVNDPFIISRHDKMVAIAEARKVDLTGLVCARHVGPRFGDGFIYGTSRAKGGRTIVTLASTRNSGQESNIVLDIEAGTGIPLSTRRVDVHYVVTEYGIAEMLGRSIRERALALIQIAHPRFRDELLAAAKKRRYVYPDQASQRNSTYPDRFETKVTMADDLRILLRPARPADERKVQILLYGMDDDSIRYRFHERLETMHHERVQEFVNVDYDETVTILAFRLNGNDQEQEVVGMGQYLYYSTTNQAEVAFTTSSEFRQRGIATCILHVLIRMARDRKIPKLFAQVLRENQSMLSVFHKSGVPIVADYADGYHHITLYADPDASANDRPAVPRSGTGLPS